MRLFIYIYIILSIGYPAGPVASYCDYDSGSTTDSSKTNYYHYITGNNQEICNSRMLRSLEVLNANYAPAGIQFVLHSDYPNMLHATDPGFDGFFERATGGTADFPNANDLREHYNIPNALNIYIVDFVNTREGTSGISLFPWNIDSNIPGAFFKHGFLPGDVDANESAEYDRTLMHEIGHYFGLLHINGIWYLKEGNTPRDLFGWDDCNEKGDTICDTPAEPGMSDGAWYTNSSDRECIYHGYGGNYDASDSTLQIGGYKHTYYSGTYPFYDYCEEWEVEDPYEVEYFVMASDTTDSPIPPGCGTLITFDLDGVPTMLSDIHARNSLGKYIEFSYYPLNYNETIDLCDLQEMSIQITEDGNVFYKSSEPISKFQFNIDGARILGVSGGKAKDNNFHFQFDHCRQFTNYDNDGKFFGTSGLESNECNNDDGKSEYATATGCHIDNYSYGEVSGLPIGHNFMRAASSPYNNCGISPLNDNNYYDEIKSGFTREQYENIRYFVEHCYTGCWDETACNFDITSTHLLNKGLSSCKYTFNGICDTTNDCLQPSDPMSGAPRSLSRSKGLDFVSPSYLNSLSENDLDCATDELYGDFTDEVWDNLIKIRKKVKQTMNNNINRTILNTIYIPIVFHNLYKIETLSSNTTLKPINFEINQIYPNPFNPITTIRYGLAQNATIQVLIYDIKGRVITTLIDGFQTAGYHSVIWNASKFSSGIYFLNMSAGEIAETKKMVLIK